MKTLENIQLNKKELIIGWVDSSVDDLFHTTKFVISDLTSDQKLTISNFNSILSGRMGNRDILEKSISQISSRQHLCEERVLWYIKGDDSPKFMLISSINNSERIIYVNYKNLCDSIK